MKLAVLGDVHGNLEALKTVTAHLEQWQPDLVVATGDIVNRGPRPFECLQFIQQKQQSDGWLVVRGNHEDYVISYDNPDTPRSGPEFEIFRSAFWTYQQLNGNVSDLKAMPFQVNLTGPNGEDITVAHASMRSNSDGIFPKTTDDQLRQKICPADQSPPALLCVGHTHWPLIRQIDRTLVVNVGAVGLPFDSDPRAAYAQVSLQDDRWQTDIIRLEYNRAQTEQDFFESGYLTEGGPLVRLILDEFYIARPHLYRWTQQYHDLTVAGEISLEEAVDTYLAEQHAPGNSRV